MTTKPSVILLSSFAFLAVLALVLFVFWRSSSDVVADPALPAAADFAATAIGSSSEGQASVLSDGTVTLEELNAATERAAQCARDGGANASVVPGAGKRPATILLNAGSTLATAEAARAVLAACQQEHSEAVETTWALQQAAASSDEVAAAHTLLSSCIQERGAAIDDGYLSVDDLNRLMLKNAERTESERLAFDAYLQCRNPVMEELGYQLP